VTEESTVWSVILQYMPVATLLRYNASTTCNRLQPMQ